MKREIPKGAIERTFTIDATRADEDTRTLTAALSSETPVERFFGTEILVHEAEAIDMTRAIEGLPLLWSHDHEAPIGRVENVRLDQDRVMRGDLRFSKNKRAAEIWQDVRDGFLRDMSIGYSIDEYEEKDNGEISVIRWTPLEASVVTVPADARVGINRSKPQEGKTMSDDKKPAAVDTDTGQQKPEVRSELKLFSVQKERERKEGARAEAQRRSEIRELFSRYVERYGDAFGDLQRACEDSPEISVDQAKQAILDAIADGYVSVDVSARQSEGSAFQSVPGFERKRAPGFSGTATAGEDALDKFQRGAELALTIRSGAVVDDKQLQEAQGGELISMSPTEMAREYLRIQGVAANGNRENIIGQALKRSGMSGTTGHFASVLENVANKSMNDGFMQADESWSMWCQTRSIPDFKTASLLNLSLFSDLDEVREAQQYEHGDVSDIKETIQLATYGKLFAITRQALANDDLSALGDIPRAMGASAARKVGDLAYAILTNGTTATMTQDGVELFAAAHSNYVTSGAAPSVATVEAGRTAMALQTDPQGVTLGIRPQYLIVPEALRSTANTLVAAQYDPAGTAGTLTPNTIQGTVTAVSDHRLDAFNAAGWFLAAARNTVVVGFLNGQQTPSMESKDGWDVDGIEYKVRIDAAAAAADFRGLYYNDGA